MTAYSPTQVAVIHTGNDEHVVPRFKFSPVAQHADGPYRVLHIGNEISIHLAETAVLPFINNIRSEIDAVMFEIFPPDENGDQ